MLSLLALLTVLLSNHPVNNMCRSVVTVSVVLLLASTCISFTSIPCIHKSRDSRRSFLDSAPPTTTSETENSVKPVTVVNGDTTTSSVENTSSIDYANNDEKQNVVLEESSSATGEMDVEENDVMDDVNAFELISGRAAACLWESDMRRDAKGDKHDKRIASGATNWIDDSTSFALQKAADKIKLKVRRKFGH